LVCGVEGEGLGEVGLAVVKLAGLEVGVGPPDQEAHLHFDQLVLLLLAHPSVVEGYQPVLMVADNLDAAYASGDDLIQPLELEEADQPVLQHGQVVHDLGLGQPLEALVVLLEGLLDPALLEQLLGLVPDLPGLGQHLLGFELLLQGECLLAAGVYHERLLYVLARWLLEALLAPRHRPS
jgi:hypothetical protein